MTDVIDKLEANGVWMAVCLPDNIGGNSVGLSPDEARRLIKVGRDRFLQEHFGMTDEKYAAWRDCCETRQCAARTTKGRRCRNSLTWFDAHHPFVNGRDNFCKRHGGGG